MKKLLLLAALLLLPALPTAAQTVSATTVSACGTPNNTPVVGNPYPVTQDTTGKLCTSASGGGGGGAVTIADGADVTQGTTTDTACATDNGTCTVEALVKRANQRLTTLITAVGTPMQQTGGTVGVLLNGAAPSITNPIWIANAEAADTSGTFTNATQTNSVTNTNADGYATALVSVNGTYGTASGVFEESDDAGVTFYGIICTRSDGSATETGYTGLTNVSRQWSCPVAGNDSVRIRSTAVASGTVNARVGISAPPNNSGVATSPAAGASSTNSLAANQVVKASPGTLLSFEVQADSTLSAAAWWVMIYNATSAPADGAVTPAKCYAQTTGTTQMGGSFATGGVAFSTGIVIGVSTTGCFTKTASTHAFISGDFQ